MEKSTLRSQNWFGKTGKDGFIYRAWMKNQGIPKDFFEGRTVENFVGHKDLELERAQVRRVIYGQSLAELRVIRACMSELFFVSVAIGKTKFPPIEFGRYIQQQPMRVIFDTRPRTLQ